MDIEGRKQRRLTQNIPEDRFSPSSKDLEIVELKDMRREYALVIARLDFWREDGGKFGIAVRMTARDVVSRYCQENQFDKAIKNARIFEEDMQLVFARLAEQCIRMSTKDFSASIGDGPADWLLTDEVSSWTGTQVERGWRFLQRSLERHDLPAQGCPYRKASFDKILEMGRLDCLPTWLLAYFEDYEPEFLIRSWLKRNYVAQALEQSLKLVRKANAPLARMPPQTAAVTWLPYNLLDDVMAYARDDKALDSHCRSVLESLTSELGNRIKRLQKWKKDA